MCVCLCVSAGRERGRESSHKNNFMKCMFFLLFQIEFLD